MKPQQQQQQRIVAKKETSRAFLSKRSSWGTHWGRRGAGTAAIAPSEPGDGGVDGGLTVADGDDLTRLIRYPEMTVISLWIFASIFMSLFYPFLNLIFKNKNKKLIFNDDRTKNIWILKNRLLIINDIYPN